MKSTLKTHRDKLKALFAQHNPPQDHPEPPKDEPPTETAEPIPAGPEPADPPEFDQKALAEEVAKQVGWQPGDKVTGRVTNRQMVVYGRWCLTGQRWCRCRSTIRRSGRRVLRSSVSM
jgi:hypothetical protein